MRKRLTAALDIRSSCMAIGSPNASDNAPAQSRAAWAAGPAEPSIDSGNPTTQPPAFSLRANTRISAALAFSLPRRRLPYGVASVSRTSDSASPIVLLPGSTPISRCSRTRTARTAATVGRRGMDSRGGPDAVLWPIPPAKSTKGATSQGGRHAGSTMGRADAGTGLRRCDDGGDDGGDDGDAADPIPPSPRPPSVRRRSPSASAASAAAPAPSRSAPPRPAVPN